MQEQTFVNYKKNAYELGLERLRSMELVETPSILEEMADKAIVLNLLKNGHKVASADIIDIELPTSIDTASLCKLIVDIRDKEAIDSSVHKVISEFGGLEVLVNVAGICYSGDPETIDAQE